MKKIIFIEGLPNVGKTYLLNQIKELNLDNVHVVDELINPSIYNPYTDPEEVFLINDEMKVNKYKNGIVLIDRGPISTLVYNQVKHIIDNNYNTNDIEKWFEKFKDLYKNNNTYNYYLYNPDKYSPSLDNKNNPFGSVDNLKLTHELTIYNLKKYSSNFKIIIYKKDNLKEVINEIIN